MAAVYIFCRISLDNLHNNHIGLQDSQLRTMLDGFHVQSGKYSGQETIQGRKTICGNTASKLISVDNKVNLLQHHHLIYSNDYIRD